MSARLPLYQVDAFTDRPFSGNPAAVCLIEGARTDEWMQSVAAEMNLSETAFVRWADGRYGLRWFTPTVEVDLCGHATLATAHVLFATGRVAPGTHVEFRTRSGILSATSDAGWITLDFPATPAMEAEPPTGLLEALGVTARFVGRSRFDVLVEVETEEVVRAARPDFVRLTGVDARGVMLTAAVSRGDADFVSRFFAPRVGVPEDPVTGSAHCALGPYWAARLGRNEVVGYQASKRGGTIRVRVRGDRVDLCGRAVTVLDGVLAS